MFLVTEENEDGEVVDKEGMSLAEEDEQVDGGGMVVEEVEAFATPANDESVFIVEEGDESENKEADPKDGEEDKQAAAPA